MLIVGLWHGAALTFVIWGLLHGLYLSLQNLINWIPMTAKAQARIPKALKPLGILVVFGCVCFAWIFFQANSVPTALLYIRGLFALHSLPSIHLLKGVCLLAGVLLLDLPGYLTGDE